MSINTVNQLRFGQVVYNGFTFKPKTKDQKHVNRVPHDSRFIREPVQALQKAHSDAVILSTPSGVIIKGKLLETELEVSGELETLLENQGIDVPPPTIVDTKNPSLFPNVTRDLALLEAERLADETREKEEENRTKLVAFA